MSANTTYVVFGYELVEKQIEVSAPTQADALWAAEEAGLMLPYDAEVKESNDEL